MFGFTQWKGLIGGAHVPDWTCFTPVGLHCIKGSLSPLGAIIRTHGKRAQWKNPLDRHCNADGVFYNVILLCVCTPGKYTNTHTRADWEETWPREMLHWAWRLYIYGHARTLRNDCGWFPLQSLGVSVVQHKAGPVCARLWNGMWRRGQHCDTRHHLYSSLSSFAVLNFY